MTNKPTPNPAPILEGTFTTPHGFTAAIVYAPYTPTRAKQEQRSGHRCGYIALHPGHPLYRLSYNTPIIDHLQVHGGITYGRAGGPSITYPTPTPRPTWWLGFDTAHSQDYGIVRSITYIYDELNVLSSQLTTIKGPLTYSDLHYPGDNDDEE